MAIQQAQQPAGRGVWLLHLLKHLLEHQGINALRLRLFRRPGRRLELIGSAVRQGQLLACVVCRRHREHAQQVAERGPAQAAQQHATRRHLEWLGDAQRDGDAGESLERDHEGTDSGARPAGQRLQHQARAEDEVGQRDQPEDVGIVRPVFRGW